MIDEWSLIDVFEARFEPTHLAASQTRQRLRTRLDEVGVERGLADDVELAASELLSNAVEQAPAEPVEVLVHLDGTALYLTVTNHHPAASVPGLAFEITADDDGTLAERGRGLAIVQMLADGMWLHGDRTWTSVSCLHKRRG